MSLRAPRGIQVQVKENLSMKSLNLLCASLVVTLLPLSMAGSDTKPSAPKLTAAEIVDKNVAARGGLAAWRAVQTIEMKGTMEAGGNQRSTLPVPGATKGMMKGVSVVPPRPKEQAQLPFVMDLKRGRKQRIELEFKGQTALQVYDGVHGWKLRPFLNRHEVENFTPDELKAASTQTDLDGLLIDYAAKGSKVELESVDRVEGRNAYNLKVTDKSGNARHVWVDSETFLETKIEGTPRRLDGKYHPVAVYFHDYRTVSGLVMPYLLVTAVEGSPYTEKITIENIISNPKLNESRFAKPN
jgi:outer membrane lipoprotein-sorting protein